MTITITTPLYYANDKPHLGSTYSTLACDAFARYQRLNGSNVNFITGVDEHGQKIERTAHSNNISPYEHCNNIVEQYISLWQTYSITNNHFIRTTSIKHKALVTEFFKRVHNKGDIRIGNQKGWYCVGCEEYKDESEYDESKICPIHRKPLEWRDEENLFFCLSNYQKEIEELIQNPGFIEPISRRNEIIKFVSTGLKDFSISRVNLDWGIPVPEFKGQTFYVWFDALLGYISALIPDNETINLDDITKYGWPATVHIIGKDILRFHAIYWPAMLMSAGLEVPKKVFGHGFLTREGQKMGKSLGNVLDPLLLLETYGEDPIRWYLLSDIKFGQDGDFQKKRFVDLINNDLANTIGNLLNRTITMSRKWFNDSIPEIPSGIQKDSLKNEVTNTITIVLNKYSELSFNEACRLILKLASTANQYLNENEPWKKIKQRENYNHVACNIYNILETCRIIAILILPITPSLGQKMLSQLNYSKDIKNWHNHLKWGLLKQGNQLEEPFPLIGKLEY